MADPTAAEIVRVRRLAIGEALDRDTLSDADISDLFANEGAGSTLLTAAEACDMLANRAAKSFTFTADGATMRVNERVKQYREAAEHLRRRYFSSGTIVVTRADDEDDDTEYAS